VVPAEAGVAALALLVRAPRLILLPKHLLLHLRLVVVGVVVHRSRRSRRSGISSA
jgi:hypothetical protein